jgi:hypothetical protein
MAREAGLEITVDPTETPWRTFVEGWEDQLKAFEAIVRADERKQALAAQPAVQEPVAWLIPGSITTDPELAKANGDKAVALGKISTQQWNPEDHYKDGWRDALESVKRATPPAAPVQEPIKHSTVAYKLAQKELARLVQENFGRMPKNNEWADSVLDLRDALESQQNKGKK